MLEDGAGPGPRGRISSRRRGTLPRAGRVRRRCWIALAVGACTCGAVQPVHAQEPPRETAPGDAAGHAGWAGPYLGLGASAGGSVGRYGFVPAGGIGGRSGFGAARDDTPWLAGGFAGYNWQRGRLVFGLDGVVAAAALKRAAGSDQLGGTGPGSSTDLLRVKRDALGSVRARLGYALDDYLLYATAGIALAEERARWLAVPGATFRDRRASEGAGFTFGMGIETILTPNLVLGIDYQRATFGAARAAAFDPFGGSGPRARIATDDVMARLSWFPAGLRPAPEPPEDKPGERAEWSLHGQTTFIQQATPRFRSPYAGEFSFLPTQSRQIWSLTAYVGRRLWEGAELYVNPELNQGFGLSRTLGIAGYINGEAQKAGAPYPKLRPQRYFLRQVFGLGGETEAVPDGLNQIAGTRDIDRITVTVGKFAVGDFFDDNAYAHDPRLNFNNWSFWASSAFDFPANLPGFTQGAVVELNRKEWAVRAGFFQVPKDPNSDVLDPRIDRKGGAVVELEQRYDVGEQSGKLRLGVFSNSGRSADYRQATALANVSGLDPNDAAFQNRKDRRKSGVYANLEHTLTPDLGLFARASYNDGRSQIMSFTDVDRSLSGGLALKGTAWDRPKDTIGIGASGNFLSAAHRDFLAAGGLGLLIGDGRLTYAPEQAIETYYKLNLTRSADLTFDYQRVTNPGYNADRGPVNVFGLRLHAEF